MSNVILILKRFFTAVMAILMAFVPFSGGRDAKTENEVRLRAAIVSDVHIDGRLPLGQSALKTCYGDMNGFGPDAAVVLGVKFWVAPADDEHPYGHGKIEALVTLFIALALAVVAYELGAAAVRRLVEGTDAARPDTSARRRRI